MKDWKDVDGVEVWAEATRVTADAFVFAELSVKSARDAGADLEICQVGSVMRVMTAGAYLTEFRGQSSATAHGCHGAHPDRIAALREWSRRTGFPVRLVFVETIASEGFPDKQSWYFVVLDRDEPAGVWIARGEAGAPERKRAGWRCKDLKKGYGRVPFPPELPTNRPRSQLAFS